MNKIKHNKLKTILFSIILAFSLSTFVFGLVLSIHAMVASANYNYDEDVNYRDFACIIYSKSVYEDYSTLSFEVFNSDVDHIDSATISVSVYDNSGGFSDYCGSIGPIMFTNLYGRSKSGTYFDIYYSDYSDKLANALKTKDISQLSFQYILDSYTTIDGVANTVVYQLN